MDPRAWCLLALSAAVTVSTGAAAGTVMVFDFDCADPATYPEGKISVDVDPEVLRLGGKVWANRAVSADLNRDGRPEFFVPTSCGATGICDWAVFAIEPSKSLGLISGERLYVEDAGDPWLRITAYLGSGLGRGSISTYRMANSHYSKVSSLEIDDPENSRFLERMGQPFCRSDESAGRTVLNPLTVDPACPFATSLPPSDVLIGYMGDVRQTATTRVGRFRALGIVRDGALLASDGAAIRDKMEFWQVLAASAPPIALKDASSFLDPLSDDHCVFHADLKEDLAPWTLLSSRPFSGMFRSPDASDTAYFAEHHNDCVDQGDFESLEEPPCSRPRLLAMSDLNHDGAEEFWATEPYRWDTGITVWQRTETGLTEILAVCTGCSD